MTMVFIAPQKVVAAGACPSSPLPLPCGASRRKAIQTSSAPPISIRPGIFSSQTTTMVMALRTTIAPKVPQTMACFCRWRGRLRAASAMTIALSPASTRSITTMAASAERKSAERNSMTCALSIAATARVQSIFAML